eukprot:TRINITY_DN22866_c0_g1_i2.p1 TRINITY_DN22866_c0_g1~~TRINITY_DN22866_c0_g1_i2.p1  ORF type:complete len:415 (+),score=91.24 TRINITY_DN22866_c0_g1_i2:103-1347(+)
MPKKKKGKAKATGKTVAKRLDVGSEFLAEDSEPEDVEPLLGESDVVTPVVEKILHFAEDPMVKAFELRHLCLGETGARLFARAIGYPFRRGGPLRRSKMNPEQPQRSMDVLDLSGNYICRVGVELMLQALQVHCRLKRLALSWASLGDDSCDALAEAMTGIAGLKELDISNNRFGEFGASRIGQAIEWADKLQLKVLNMCGNPITERGGQRLAAAQEAARRSGLVVQHDFERPAIKMPFLKMPAPSAVWNADVARPLLNAGATHIPDEPWRKIAKFRRQNRQESLPALSDSRPVTAEGKTFTTTQTRPGSKASIREDLDEHAHVRPRRISATRPPSRAHLILHLDRAPVTLPSMVWPAASKLSRSVSEATLMGSRSINGAALHAAKEQKQKEERDRRLRELMAAQFAQEREKEG